MKRIEWLDDIKGVAIALVVAGHVAATMRNITTGCVQSTMQVAFDFIYSFHIPLFFVLAGLTFSADKKFVEFFRRKFFRLMVLYYI